MKEEKSEEDFVNLINQVMESEVSLHQVVFKVDRPKMDILSEFLKH